jgi:D-alanine--poly(phosphoribitol) ligase subunit 2
MLERRNIKMTVDKQQVIKILSDTINAEINELANVKMDDDLRDWGLDSLKSIDIIVALENEFEIAIEDEDLLIDNFNTIEKIISLIKKYTDS